MKYYAALKPVNLIPTGRIHKDKTGYGIASIYNLARRVNKFSGEKLREIRQKQTQLALAANEIYVTNVKQF